MIDKIQIKNLRSLTDTKAIELKKINVLVGKNSAGKSTFLRTFPLLRQSAEARTKAPILWYGRLVDFGSFREARNSRATNSPMSIRFDYIDRSPTPKRPRKYAQEWGKIYDRSKTIRATIELGGRPTDSVGLASKLTLELCGDRIVLNVAPAEIESILINDEEYELPEDIIWHVNMENIIPQLIMLYPRRGKDGQDYYVSDSTHFVDEIVQVLGQLSDYDPEALTTAIKQLRYASKDGFLTQLRSDPLLFKTHGISQERAHAIAERARKILLVVSLPTILSDLETETTQFARGVRYVQPVRASAERYYRIQDLAVDEIDSSGGNTAMLLHSLDTYEKHLLKQWMQQHLGFFASAERSAGHVAVTINLNGESTARNIADLGFGYSQVLPIILQLWFSCVRERYAYPVDRIPVSLLAMEQPELHLHPNYQALLADVFTAVCKDLEKNSRKVPLIIETHSEHIVNRLGQKVALGHLHARDVQILLFEQDNASTTVKSVMFDDEGVLQEPWPLGFFLPEV